MVCLFAVVVDVIGAKLVWWFLIGRSVLQENQVFMSRSETLQIISQKITNNKSNNISIHKSNIKTNTKEYQKRVITKQEQSKQISMICIYMKEEKKQTI